MCSLCTIFVLSSEFEVCIDNGIKILGSRFHNKVISLLVENLTLIILCVILCIIIISDLHLLNCFILFLVNCTEDHIFSSPYITHCETSSGKTLSNGKFMKYDKGHYIEFLNDGIITEYFGDSWRPVCVSHGFSEKTAFKVCREIGYM